MDTRVCMCACVCICVCAVEWLHKRDMFTVISNWWTVRVRYTPGSFPRRWQLNIHEKAIKSQSTDPVTDKLDKAPEPMF